MHVADEICVAGLDLGHALDMPARNDEHVSGCLRVDVPECDDPIILMDHLRVHSSRGDFAEYAWFTHAPRLRPSSGATQPLAPLIGQGIDAGSEAFRQSLGLLIVRRVHRGQAFARQKDVRPVISPCSEGGEITPPEDLVMR